MKDTLLEVAEVLETLAKEVFNHTKRDWELQNEFETELLDKIYDIRDRVERCKSVVGRVDPDSTCYCSVCGDVVKSYQKYCSECGSELDWTEV